MRKTFVSNPLFNNLCSRILALLTPIAGKQIHAYQIDPQCGEYGPTRIVIETEDHITPPFVLHLDMVEAPMPEDVGGVVMLGFDEAAMWLASELADDLAEMRESRAIAASAAECHPAC